MDLQDKADVILIQHAYVHAEIRGQLLTHLCQTSRLPILIGTWADVHWAIRFYQRHGFELLAGQPKDTLLTTYWNISRRQVETSVVLRKI